MGNKHTWTIALTETDTPHWSTRHRYMLRSEPCTRALTSNGTSGSRYYLGIELLLKSDFKNNSLIQRPTYTKQDPDKAKTLSQISSPSSSPTEHFAQQYTSTPPYGRHHSCKARVPVTLTRTSHSTSTTSPRPPPGTRRKRCNTAITPTHKTSTQRNVPPGKQFLPTMTTPLLHQII